MRGTVAILDVPLRSAFRFWGNESLLREAFRWRIEMMSESPGSPERTAAAAKAESALQKARETSWQQLHHEICSVTGLPMPVTSKTKREIITSGLLFVLKPDFVKGSAKFGEEVEFVDIRV